MPERPVPRDATLRSGAESLSRSAILHGVSHGSDNYVARHCEQANEWEPTYVRMMYGGLARGSAISLRGNEVCGPRRGGATRSGTTREGERTAPFLGYRRWNQCEKSSPV